MAGTDDARRHAELAIEAFNEGLNFVSKGNAVQSSEKLYKAVEEGVKALAIAKNLDEAREAMEQGRWSTKLLGRAAARLGPVARHAWLSGYYLHVEGFHEARLDIDDVKMVLEDIEALIQEVRKLLSPA